MVTQLDIARKLGIDVSCVNKILNRRGGRFNEKTVRKVFQVARALGFRFERLKYVHRRRYERSHVGLEAKIQLHAADGSVVDQGTCIIDDIAVCGASLVRVELSKGSLPLRQLTISLSIELKKGSVAEVKGTIVRLCEEGQTIKLGVAFAELEPGIVRALRKLV